MRLTNRTRFLTLGLAAMIAAGLIGAAGVALADDPPPGISEGDQSTPAPEGLRDHRKACRLRLARVGMRELVEASGLDRQTVIAGLRGGKTLEQIFAANGLKTQDVIAEALADLRVKLDEKVNAGALTRQKADVIYRAAEKGLPKLVTVSPKRACADGRIGRAVRAELKIAADTIGISPADLLKELKDGKTIAQVASAHDVSPDTVIAGMLKPINDRIDKALSDGKIDATKAAEMKDRARERITRLVNEGHPKVRSAVPVPMPASPNGPS